MLAGLYPKPGGVPLDYFQPDRWTQLLLGDIHDPLLIDEHDNVRYIGAPMQHNFGDAGGVRGFYLLTTNDGDLQYIENDVSPRFHIVGHDGDLAGIRPTDYVRVTDPALTQDARGRTERVEVRGVADDARTVHVRLNSTGRGEEVLRSYCEIKGVTGGDQERLVALGLELLEEGGNQ
jgi:DNA repair exonuclease SbcCD nuclease subunit